MNVLTFYENQIFRRKFENFLRIWNLSESSKTPKSFFLLKPSEKKFLFQLATSECQFNLFKVTLF